MLDVALYHAEQFRVIPLYEVLPTLRCSCNNPGCDNSRGKHPRIPSWQNVATRDESQIRAWWKQWPEAGVGLAMGGPERCIALDVDGPEGRAALEALEKANAPLPRTLTTVSGRADGGEHRFFRVPSGWDLGAIKNNAGKVGEHLDVRADGGQVVAPGTLHHSGRPYDIGVDAPVAELPEWLYKALVAAGKKGPAKPLGDILVSDDDRKRARAIIEASLEKLREARPGTRNNTINEVSYTIGGLVAAAGYDLEEVRERIRVVAQGTGHQRVDGTLDHAFDAGLANPFDFVADSLAKFEALRDRFAGAVDVTATVFDPLFYGAAVDLSTVHFEQLRALIKSKLKGDTARWDRKVKEAKKAIAKAERTREAALARAPRDERALVEVTEDEHLTLEATLKALGALPNVYRRGDALVRIKDNDDDSKSIQPIDKDHLRALCSEACFYFKIIETESGAIRKQQAPPDATVRAAHTRHDYGGAVRPLEGIANAPVLRKDGTACAAQGYDEATGLFLSYEPKAFPMIPEKPSLSDAQLGVGYIKDVLGDFPFETPGDLAVALSMILTPIARNAFEGPSPLHAIDAAKKGTGKTLLAEVAYLIATGRKPTPTSAYASDEEWQKVLLAAAIAGDDCVFIDNVRDGQPLKSTELEKILTGTSLKGRILGQTRIVEVPYAPLFVATGNNIRVGGDLDRRTIRGRLVSQYEKPEDRPAFQIADILDHVREHRGELYSAALMVLRAYICAGAPFAGRILPSFEGWSRLVGGALVWVGETDPCTMAMDNGEEDDPTADLLLGIRSVLDALEKKDRGLAPGEFVTGEIREAYIRDNMETKQYPMLHRAIEELIPKALTRQVTEREFGCMLRSKLQTIASGMLLERTNQTKGGSRVWRLTARLQNIANERTLDVTEGV